MKYGIQLYSLRDMTEAGKIEEAISAVAQMGYSYIEFAGFFGNDAKTVAALLDKYKIEVLSTHTGKNELTDELFDATVRFHREIGNKNIVIPGTDLSTVANVRDFIEFLNYVQPRLKREGIALGYHNHSGEFLPNSDGMISWYELRDNTAVELEVDTYWAWNACVDPVELLKNNSNRISLIHVKDGLAGGIGRSLGMGEAPVSLVLDTAKELGMMPIVESEGLYPTGREEVQRCIEFLKKYENNA